MPQCKITVLKKEFYSDLAEEYCMKQTQPCELFNIGDEFIAKHSMKEPENFPCSGAWSNIANLVFVLLQGGSFGPKTWKWMKDDKTMITCCSDGVRPVIFKLELLDDNN